MLAKVSASVVQPIVDRLKLSVRVVPKEAWCAIRHVDAEVVEWEFARIDGQLAPQFRQNFIWDATILQQLSDRRAEFDYGYKSGYHGSMATVLKVEKTASGQAGYRQGIKHRVRDDEAKRPHYPEPPADYYGGGY